MNTTLERFKSREFQSRYLVIFFLIVLFINWGKATLTFFGILQSSSTILDPSIILLILGGWGPTLTAIILTWITEGKAGLKELWKRFLNFKQSVKWWIVTILFVPAIWLIANFFTRLIGGWNNPLFDRPDLFFSQFALGLLAVLGEEIGWRGYVLPRFQFKWNALVSSLILGILWAAWHTRFVTELILNPIFKGIMPGFSTLEWLVWIITSSIFITWIFNNTHGSILVAVVFHNMMNAGSYFFWCCTASWHWAAVLVSTAVLIVILFGPKNLIWQRRKVEAN